MNFTALTSYKRDRKRTEFNSQLCRANRGSWKYE
jgi:hypothetical protein